MPSVLVGFVVAATLVLPVIALVNFAVSAWRRHQQGTPPVQAVGDALRAKRTRPRT